MGEQNVLGGGLAEEMVFAFVVRGSHSAGQESLNDLPIDIYTVSYKLYLKKQNVVKVIT